MDESLLETLPVAQRLALSYAPRSARGHVLTLLALDNRLAGILRQRGETIIAQMKLAWWRDRLGEEPAAWPRGEPLLARIAELPFAPARLLPLVDGWEALLAEQLTASGVEEFAQGRALAWQALGEACAAQAGNPVERAAREWSYVDLAHNLGDAQEARAARDQARACKWRKARLPRALRPLQVLHALSRRALERGSGELLDGPGAAWLAIRVGITGR